MRKKIKALVCIILGIVLLITLIEIVNHIKRMKDTPPKEDAPSHEISDIQSDSEQEPENPENPDTVAPENTTNTIDYNDAQQLATAYIGRTTDELLAHLGEPASKSYTENDEGYGEYGIWYYENFVVYTYKNLQGEEIIESVS